MNQARKSCFHPRQLTADGRLLPCATPRCCAGVPNPVWYAVRLINARTCWFQEEPLERSRAVTIETRYSRIATATGLWFWENQQGEVAKLLQAPRLVPATVK